jgi:hypothetical protein
MTRRSFSISHLLVIALTAGLLLAGVRASAQRKATVYIPFAFTANHQTMPAGYYSLELLSDRFLCFSDSRNGKHQAVIMVQPESGDYIETRGRLRFVMREDRHYLTEVRFAGSSMHSRPVVSPSLARELAKSAQPDSSFEIAIK